MHHRVVTLHNDHTPLQKNYERRQKTSLHHFDQCHHHPTIF